MILRRWRGARCGWSGCNTKDRESFKDIWDFGGYDRQELIGATNFRKATAMVAMYWGMMLSAD